jgi:hypothetical protein
MKTCWTDLLTTQLSVKTNIPISQIIASGWCRR